MTSLTHAKSIEISSYVIAIVAALASVLFGDYTLVGSVVLVAAFSVVVVTVGLFIAAHTTEDLYRDLVDAGVVESPGPLATLAEYARYPTTLRDDVAALERKIDGYESRDEHIDERFVDELVRRLSAAIERRGHDADREAIEGLIRRRLDLDR